MSHGETNVDNYDGSKPPRNEEQYGWVKRHCRLAGMDEQHVSLFLSKHRPWGWCAMKPGVNVCDLIADFVTEWKQRSPEEYKYTQELIRNGVL